MVLKTPNGFQYSGHLGGGVHSPAHRYQKSITAGVDSVIFIGDPIALTSAGTVARLHANNSAAGAVNNHFLGVCTGIYETEDGRPLTHRTNKYAATADAFWIDVIDDPDAVWEVRYGASANQTVLGTLSYAGYGTPVSAAGISGAYLTSALPAASTVNSPFKVIGIVNLNRDGQTNDGDGVVRVINVSHVWRENNAL